MTGAGKWALIFFAVMVLAAVAGFLIAAVRIIAGILFVVCLAAFVASLFIDRSRRSTDLTTRS